jgi:hypothetical protein
MAKRSKAKSNLKFFNSFKMENHPGETLLVIDGKIAFKNKNASKVVEQYSKMKVMEDREVSIITVPKNRSVMVV